MPCWTVQTMSVQFRSEHLDLLEEALKAEGLRYEVNAEKTVVTINEGNDWSQIKLDLVAGEAKLRSQLQPVLNSLKKAYSMKAVEKLAAKNRWKLNVDAKNKSKGTFQRTFLR